MELEIFTVDAFTDRPFSGNPAAVCVVRRPEQLRALSEPLMQAIAAEMNLSETAFVSPASLQREEDGGGSGGDGAVETCSTFSLRWFTPTREVPLCGHATLATSAVIFHALGHHESDTLTFSTRESGLLKARREEGNYITLDFPIGRCVPAAEEEGRQLRELVRLAVGDAPVADLQYCGARNKLLVRLGDGTGRAGLEALRPAVASLPSARQPSWMDIRGVIVTARGGGGSEYDFLSRYFAPWNGIPEDPVTGSAHTVLADYWSRVLGKAELMGRQCSPRGGDVRVRVDGDRVFLSGKACIVVRGTLKVESDTK